MTLADNEILAALEPGNGTFEQLRTTLNRYCLSLTECPWDAEDLAQDTWVKALSSLKYFNHHNPEALLLRIAKNAWIDRTRRQSVLVRILKSEQIAASLPDNGFLEIEIALHALMEHLSPLQRTVFLLREVFDFSIAETAAKLQTTEGAVKAALHRARKSLDAIRGDMEAGTIPLPSEEHERTFLRALASAYRTGDVPTLVELAMQVYAEPVMAIGVLQTPLSRQSHAVQPMANSHFYSHSATQSFMRMVS
ncbi:RNA polymerase sigma factor [Cohnella herbarum]|uniref:RNA polymerase sigma factor n=1 Tax=Cohnella herbarum TaxID=2728023 RepID=A0A7Z2VP83_9BACL|nr:RNA polymerase sigma factor [Cohnella herbarum]QJD86973.1 RNA polymerase sigma factor [Cohnella herbarum]